MDHSNPTNSWFHSQFESTQPIHPPVNPHLDDQSVISPITHYRPHPPVNHQQFQPSQQPSADLAALSSTSFSQFPVGPIPQNGAIPEWTQWEQGLTGRGGDQGGMYSSQPVQSIFEHSPALDLYNTDPMANWRPKQQPSRLSSSHQGSTLDGSVGSSYTAFSAFLNNPSQTSTNNKQPQTQPSSVSHSPAVSPLHQPIPLAHNSPPPFVSQFNRSNSYAGVPADRPHPAPHHAATHSFAGSFTQITSPQRPGIQYHTEPSRRAHQPLSARSMPSDWQAAYAHSLNEQRVRAQSTSHISLNTGAPTDWSISPSTSQHQSDGYSYLGLNLGAERSFVGEVGGSGSSEGGLSDWAPGLVPADQWQHQTIPPSDLHPSGLVAGRFENEHSVPHPVPDLAGPSSSRFDSPALGPRLESLELTANYSPQSRPSSQLSTPKSAVATSFSAYDPQAPASDGRKGRVPRRKPTEPPRNPNMRRYPCPLCVVTPRTFARPSALKIHMLTHTKEKREYFHPLRRVLHTVGGGECLFFLSVADPVASRLSPAQRIHAPSASGRSPSRPT